MLIAAKDTWLKVTLITVGRDSRSYEMGLQCQCLYTDSAENL